VDGFGNVYITDSSANLLLRQDYADPPEQSFVQTNVGSTSSDSPKTAVLSNLGNLPLNLTGVGCPTDFPENTGDTKACTAGDSLNPFQQCDIPVNFTPKNGGTFYEGIVVDDNSLNATGATQSITVAGVAVGGSQAITFSTIPPQIAGTSISLNASASSGLPVAFASLTATVCTVSGTTASLISYGHCTIQSTQPGNGIYFAATPVNQTFTVGHASQSITFSGIGNQLASTSVNLYATATSGLPVGFTSTTPAICTVSGSTAALIAAGFCAITASQPGNNEYFAAPSVSQQFGVGHASQTITFQPITGSHVAATTVNLSATASSGLPVTFASATPIVCTVSGSTASLIAFGFCTIEATLPGINAQGNSEYFAAPPVLVTFSVGHASQAISFPAISGSHVAASTLTLSATVTSGLPVSFASTTPAVCAVTGTTASLIASGLCGINASQAGNDEYFAAPTVGQEFGVGHATQTITFAPSGPLVAASTVNLNPTATSGLPVTLASTTPAVCTVSSTSAVLLTYGFCIVDASVGGNNVYFVATSAKTFGIGHASQTINFPAIASQVVGTPLTLSATASSGLPVSFASITPAVCTVAGTAASFAAAGKCTIQATQAGNSTYSGATPVSRGFTVVEVTVAKH
jgi:hypothetical protein